MIDREHTPDGAGRGARDRERANMEEPSGEPPGPSGRVEQPQEEARVDAEMSGQTVCWFLLEHMTGVPHLGLPCIV